MQAGHGAVVALLAMGMCFLAACGGGGSSGGGNNPVPDTTPDAFAFVEKLDTPLSAQVISAPVTITGIDTASPISVSGGWYSIGCTQLYVMEAGTVNPNEQVCMRHISASTPLTRTESELTVGGVSATFASTTGVVGDSTPDAFTFVDQVDVPPSTRITSAEVSFTGLTADTAISVSGGAYSIGCTDFFITEPGTITPFQSVCVRHTSAPTGSTDTNTVLTVGGVSGTFTSTTVSAEFAIRLRRVFPALSFSRPVAMAQVPYDASRWFVVEQGGIIRVFDNTDDVASSSVFLDISDRVGDSSGEKGLFSMAFVGSFELDGHVFVHYTRSSPSLTSVISRFTSRDGGRTLDPDSEVVILTLPQPYENHNGGQIAPCPVESLCVAFGDGGSGNDPENRAQDTTNLWGKIIRIDVRTVPYTIPSDNPFAGNARCDTGTGTAACPEIYAWGLRNPWKFNVDWGTGYMYAGDVGQGAWEEVNQIVNGGNYGWRIREGAHCNIPLSGCQTSGLTDPLVEYGRSVGRSITGGYVYRGTLMNGMIGSYVFGDFASGRIMRLFNALPPLEVMLDTDLSISSFAEDNTGELYVLDHAEGAVYRIEAAVD